MKRDYHKSRGTDLRVTRRASQALFLCLFIYILWSTTYPLKGMLPPETFFKADPLLVIIASLSERVLIPGIIVSVIMIILTLVFGRFFCGWICPLGAVFDLIRFFRRRRRITENEALNRRSKFIKYYILGTITLFAIFGEQIAWVADPLVIMGKFVSLNFIPLFTTVLDTFFRILIKDLGFHGPVHDLYRGLKGSLLGVKSYYFFHSWLILSFFILIAGSVFFIRRFWCRIVCPLGALYSLFARFSFLRRVVTKCTTCDVCANGCRMGAIKEDSTYSKGECILCMDCLYDCPSNITGFQWSGAVGEIGSVSSGSDGKKGGISRRDFLFLLSIPFLSAFKIMSGKGSCVIRPPGVLDEEHFTNRCIRCGNCMKVCITNGLQPVTLESGPAGIWTPQLVPEIGYCEYSCTLCGNTCPTGAIPRLSLDKKHRAKLGSAKIDRSACIAWAQNKECIVCEEHCPVPEKAIKFNAEIAVSGAISKPQVDEGLCVGCGICQNKCPVRPVRAIRVFKDLKALGSGAS